MAECRKCGSDPWKASDRGAYLKRVNEKGVIGIWECSPTCDQLHGNQNDALLAALEDSEALSMKNYAKVNDADISKDDMSAPQTTTNTDNVVQNEAD